jgi:hypothetical protein
MTLGRKKRDKTTHLNTPVVDLPFWLQDAYLTQRLMQLYDSGLIRVGDT